MQEIRVADPGERGLGTERHRDASGQLAIEQAAADPAVPRIDLELPLAIKAEPVGPDELGAGVLGAGDGGQGAASFYVLECLDTAMAEDVFSLPSS